MTRPVVRLITHTAYALAYIIVGASVGAVLPFVRPETDPLLGWTVGAVIVLAGGLLHESIVRAERNRNDFRRARQLQESLERMAEQITRQRAEVERLATRLEEAGRAGGQSIDYDAVMQEVRLLQSLVARLHERRPPRPPEVPRVQPAAPQRRAPDSGSMLLPTPAASAGGAGLDDASLLEVVRDALKADRIDIYLQPVVSLPQRKHRFYEVFSRVRSADNVQIMPDRYLDLAQREGLIAPIDNLLLVRCIQLIRETERRQHQIAFFSNISAATIGDAEFMRQFLQMMAQNATLVPKLVFELSQHDLMHGGAATKGLLAQLAKLGFRFSMDQVTDLDIDVDALARAEVRYVKLDRALLLDPATQADARALRRRFEGHTVDLIAEKIETESQLVEILDLGIDFGQGYLFGEPRLSRRPV